MDAGELADRAALDEAAHAAHAGDEAAVLDDGMHPARLRGKIDQRCSFGKRGGHRLFGEHVAAVPERRRNDTEPGGGNDDIEHKIGLGGGDHLGKIRADDGALEAELFRKRSQPSRG